MKARPAHILLIILILTTVTAGAGARPSEGGAWRPTLATTGFGTFVSAFSNGAAFAYDDGEDLIYASNDYGVSWTVKDSPVDLNPPVASIPSLFEMSTPKIGFFEHVGRVYKTTDGASTWKEIAKPPVPKSDHVQDARGTYYSLGAIDASDRGSTVAFGGQIGKETAYCTRRGLDATVWTSHNQGATWTRARLPVHGEVHDVTYFNKRFGVAVAYDMREVQRSDGFCLESFRDVVLMTKNGGRTFKVVKYCPHEGPNSFACTAVGMSSPNSFVIGTSNGVTYFTSNGGRTFKRATRLSHKLPVSSPQGAGEHTFWVEGIGFANSRIGYASTNGGGTWRTNDGGRNWYLEESTEKTWGYLKFGDIAVFDVERALAAGSTFVISRVPIP